MVQIFFRQGIYSFTYFLFFASDNRSRQLWWRDGWGGGTQWRYQHSEQLWQPSCLQSCRVVRPWPPSRRSSVSLQPLTMLFSTHTRPKSFPLISVALPAVSPPPCLVCKSVSVFARTRCWSFSLLSTLDYPALMHIIPYYCQKKKKK